MKTTSKFLYLLSHPNVALILSVCFAAFFLAEKIGLFSLVPLGVREILFTLTSRILITLIMVWSSVTIITSRHRIDGGQVLLRVGFIFIGLGLWLSFFTRFEGNITLMEGQAFTPFAENFNPSSLYMRRYAKVPQVGLVMKKITPVESAFLGGLKYVEADISYSGDTTGGIVHRTISSRLPLISDWTAVKLTDFGYAVNFVILDNKGNAIDGDWVYTKTYPVGSEDFFSAFLFGYTFHLRCYPEFTGDEKNPGTKGASLRDPVFNLRIVRNKDIVYNGLLTPKDRLKFDNLVFQIPRVKHWVQVSFVRDFGIPVSILGIFLLVAGGVVTISHKSNERHPK